MNAKESHDTASQMHMDLENNKRIRLQRDIENQKQIDIWLKKDPSCKEKLLKLGMIDEQDRVIPGIWIPQLEFRMPTVTIEREKFTPKKGIDGELKKKNETITYQQSEIDDLEKTIVHLARKQTRSEPQTDIRQNTPPVETKILSRKDSPLRLLPKKEALQLAGGWYALDPENKSLCVGLRLMQGRAQCEIYAEVWKNNQGRQFTASNRRSVQSQADEFLKFANEKGYDFRPHVKR